MSPLRWIRTLFGRSRYEREMREEMLSHLEHRVADLVAGGHSPRQARRQARLEFGTLEGAKEECREATGLRWPDELVRNLRFATRLLAKSPAFAVTAVITLGLCIGANAAIFSVVDAVLFRPLPYPEPDRLGLVVTHFQNGDTNSVNRSQTGTTWEVVRDRASLVDRAVFSGWPTGVNFAASGRAEFLQQQRVGAGFFSVLGVEPSLGRGFTADEDRAGGPAVAVLSHELWRRAFGGAPSALGAEVTLRGEPHTIVGIMPAGFRTSAYADLWTPLRASRTGEGGGTNYTVLTRLRPGATWTAAETEMQGVGIEAVEAMQYSSELTIRLGLEPLRSGWNSGLRSRLLLVWVAVGVVLLIGCVNIAGLLLARGSGRTLEIATRMALGGGRRAIVRQLLTESLLLASLGGLLGIGLGYLGVTAIRLYAQETLGIWQTISLDGRVLAATAAIALGTSVLFGLFPALQVTRIQIREGLSDGGHRGVVGARSRWPRRVLVTAEVALVVVLLLSAGVLVRTLSYLDGLTPGFDPTHVTTATVSLHDVRYATADRVDTLFRAGLERMRRLPGVVDAGAGLSLPYERGLNLGFRVEGDAEGDNRITTALYMTPGYLDALRVPLLRGRDFSDADRADSPAVVIVNRAFAESAFGDEDSLGRTLYLSNQPREIVGVVGDVQQTPGWGEFGPIDAVPTAYIPVAQMSDGAIAMVHTWFTPSWVVRTTGPQAGLLQAMRRELDAIDPALPFAGFRSVEDLRSSALAMERFQAWSLSVLALLALVLAAVGIAGLIATSVTERARELGVRMALGATRLQTIRSAAAPGVILTLIGLAAGFVLSQWTLAAMTSLLHGVSPTDPATYLAVAGGLIFVAAGASFVPALRVVGLDPVRVLRDSD